MVTKPSVLLLTAAIGYFGALRVSTSAEGRSCNGVVEQPNRKRDVIIASEYFILNFLLIMFI